MAPHNTNARGAEAQLLNVADPGDAGSIGTGSRITAYVGLVSAGAETRALLDPESVGQTLTLAFVTDGGDCVVTAATAINQTGDTIMTFADAGDVVFLAAIKEGTALQWRIIGNDGAALS